MRLDPQPITLTGQVVSLDIATHRFIGCTRYANIVPLRRGAMEEGIDSLAARAVAEGLAPALGVAVTMDGRTIYVRSHGTADATAGVAADDRTLWYVASTSKSFTGFGVTLLAHQGALRIDAPIAQLLPRVA